MARRRSGIGRRAVVAGLAAALGPGGFASARSDAPVFVISRSRLLAESAPTQILRQAEADLTAALQKEIDRVKAELAKEEADLTRRRDEIPPDEMAHLATDFDRRVRSVRLQAQERAKVVQAAFQEARATLVRGLPPILEQLRIEVGAVAILDADQTLAIDPGNDLTDRAIAMLNRRMPDPEVPVVDVTLTIPERAAPSDGQD